MASEVANEMRETAAYWGQFPAMHARARAIGYRKWADDVDAEQAALREALAFYARGRRPAYDVDDGEFARAALAASSEGEG